MTRPKIKRSVDCPPNFTTFKPIGIRSVQLQPMEMAIDEFEAIRLADALGLDHAESADQMNISRSTFSRLVEKARHKVAVFLVEGRRLQIEGGDIHFQENLYRCRGCGHVFRAAFNDDMNRCGECGSTDLVDLAEGFGHGRCCQTHHRPEER